MPEPSPARTDMYMQVGFDELTNTTEFTYDLVPGAISFAVGTAYALPLSAVAASPGWPSRSLLLYSIVEVCTCNRLLHLSFAVPDNPLITRPVRTRRAPNPARALATSRSPSPCLCSSCATRRVRTRAGDQMRTAAFVCWWCASIQHPSSRVRWHARTLSFDTA